MSDDIDIDAIMADIVDDDEMIVKLEKDEVSTTEEKSVVEIDLDEENALANRIVQNSIDVIDKAKEVFTSFSDDVFRGKDRSTSSKEAMLKALDVQNAANKNMIDMAKVLKDKGQNNGTNILINTVSQKKAGISIGNIQSHLDSDS